MREPSLTVALELTRRVGHPTGASIIGESNTGKPGVDVLSSEGSQLQSSWSEQDASKGSPEIISEARRLAAAHP